MKHSPSKKPQTHSDEVNPDPIDRFWDRYIELLKKQDVNQKNYRWYVLRAEQYIQAHPDVRLIFHQPAHVTNYLETLGQNPQINDWQYRQALKAIHWLFVLIKAPWVKTN